MHLLNYLISCLINTASARLTVQFQDEGSVRDEWSLDVTLQTLGPEEVLSDQTGPGDRVIYS